MKNFKYNFILLAVCGLFFTSCSKDEDPTMSSDSEKATLSFGAILNDLAKKASTKQADEYPACTDDVADYVSIVLLDAEGNEVVGTSSDPFEIDLVDGEVYTQEVPELQLVPGQYTLDAFAVYNAAGEMIWLAPRTGGHLADFIDNALPATFGLGAGVKKYIDVSVLCYDQRDLNQYGYLFFQFDQTNVINFCIFGNYCDATGRHFPAEFSVNVWRYENGAAGDVLYSNVSNEVTPNGDGDYAGTTVCLNLPDADGVEDEYYFEITLMNSDAYGTVNEEVIRSGVITDADIRALYNDGETSEYYHFREGDCNGDDSPNLFEPGDGNGNGEDKDQDGDGVVDGKDNCPNTPAGVDVYTTGEWAGCPVDTDEDGIPDYKDECPNEAGPASNNGCPITEPGFTCEEDFDNETWGDLEDCQFAYLNGSTEFLQVDAELPLFLAWPGSNESIADLTVAITEEGHVNISSSPLADLAFASGYEIIVTDNATFCESLTVDLRATPDEIEDAFDATLDLSVQNYPIWVKVRVLVCPPETE